jgi:hypothetical protein
VDLFLEWVDLPHCGRIPTFMVGRSTGDRLVPSKLGRKSTVKKIVIAAGATLLMVTAASAADLPRREPVPAYPAAPIGKMPIGKAPIGKAPYGKAPIVSPRY